MTPKRLNPTNFVLCMGWLVFCCGAAAQEQRLELAVLTAEQEQSLEEAEIAAAELEDPSYERFVAIDDLRRAYDTIDVELLIDCALSLHHGQRILLRPHRSGVTPDALLDFAGNAASQRPQAAEMNRLIEAAGAIGNEALVARFNAAKDLGAQARSVTPDLGEHSWIIHTIQDAKLLGDTDTLVRLLSELPDDLRDKQGVVDLIEQTKSSVEKSGTAGSKDPLAKLSSPNRMNIFSVLLMEAHAHYAGRTRRNVDVKVREKANQRKLAEKRAQAERGRWSTSWRINLPFGSYISSKSGWLTTNSIKVTLTANVPPFGYMSGYKWIPAN